MGRERKPITARQHITSLLVASLVLGVICGPAAIAASELEDAINKANARGAGASPTVLVLTSNVELTAPLPALSGAAKLTIRGACATSRCIISGGGAFPIFTSPSSGPTGGVLTLSNLNFQKAAGGVLFNVRAAINASQCVFAGNTAAGTGGGVLSDTFPATATPPYRLFSRCTFQSNTAPILGGGAISINAGSPLGRVPALYFLRCLFKENSAPRSLGGAISVAGKGRVRFKTCVFEGNSAGASGGGIFSYGASLSLAKVTFKTNKALGTSLAGSFASGVGAAAYAVSGLLSQSSVGFCSNSFSGNSGSTANGGSLYLQKAPGSSKFIGVVTFCNGGKPAGTVVAKNGWRVGTKCTTSTCA
ncbi:hypothetical protein CLOM_g8332 [Closterium sp. NIES-68]|nr:hypothetical protein CLOM_g8332 [Closterium sp. NIES-68]GJP59256.1 hypothetical protein CLOP_g10069 [Closterium sp. NIES-67]